MHQDDDNQGINRRQFIMTSAAAAVAGAAAAGTRTASAQESDGLDHRNERPDRMTYQKLGKTNFMCSRLVFGGGGALIAGRGVRLLERAYDAGINFYDLGTAVYYKGAEKSFSDFCKKYRDSIWVTSKAMVRADIRFRGGDKPTSVEEAEGYAKYWLERLDQSLLDLGTDYVDAYYLMGVDNPEVVKSEELGNAFLKAKEAGKVGHFGISTHTNAQACLEAAIDTGWYSLAQIAITPSGWFDLSKLRPQETDGGIQTLRPVLDRARDAGIGLIAMKVALYMSATPYTGLTTRDEDAPRIAVFDKHYDESFIQSGLSPFQRAYAYVLENGLDAVNADMQNFKHLEENVIAAKRSKELLA